MLIDNKIKDHKSLGERAKVYQIQFNSSNDVQKTWTHKCNIWPNSYCVKKKKKERPWRLSCLQAKYESTVLQFSPRTKAIYSCIYKEWYLKQKHKTQENIIVLFYSLQLEPFQELMCSEGHRQAGIHMGTVTRMSSSFKIRYEKGEQGVQPGEKPL